MERRVLVVDDEALMVESVMMMLDHEKIEAASASDYDGAVELLDDRFFPVIVSDLRLHSEEEGLRLIDAIRERTPRSRVVVLTGNTSPAVEDDLLRRGVALVLHKPAMSAVMIEAVVALLDEIEREAGATGLGAAGTIEDLYDLLGRKLHGIARRRFGLSPQAAEDVVQDAWLLFLRKRGFIREAAPWLAGTVANLSRQQIDRIVRKRETSDDDALVALPDRRGGSLTDRIALRDALARTDDRTRLLCSMIGLDGCSYDEVSAATGIPLGSVGPLYIRAKKKLRDLLVN